MSNPTMCKRIDGEPIELPALGKAIAAKCGISDPADDLAWHRYATLNRLDMPLICRLLRENRCFTIEPRGEPGLSMMFNICRAYSQITGIQMAVFDQECSFLLCVDGNSTFQQFLLKMNDDPYEAERMLQ